MRAIGTVLALLLAGCTAIDPGDPGGAGDPYFLREGMVHGINPPVTFVWDVQVEVMNDAGAFDPALIDDARWAALVDAACRLEAEAERMAAAQRFVGADPAGTLGEPPEGTDLAAIEAGIAANLPAYRALAQSFAGHTAALAAAAEARDAPELSRLVNDLQPQCAACHEVFWFPSGA